MWASRFLAYLGFLLCFGQCRCVFAVLPYMAFGSHASVSCCDYQALSNDAACSEADLELDGVSLRDVHWRCTLQAAMVCFFMHQLVILHVLISNYN